MNNLEQKINQQIAESLLLDRHRFRTKLARLLADRNKLRFAELIAVLKAQIDSSCEKTRQRRAALPLVSFPEELPISQKRQEIADAIKKHQVVVVLRNEQVLDIIFVAHAGPTHSAPAASLLSILVDVGSFNQTLV